MRSAGAPTGARVSILPPRVLKSSIVATCSLFLPQPARGAVQTALAWDSLMILADIWALFVAVVLLLAEAKLGGCAEVFGGEVVRKELGPRGSGDHGGVVGGQSQRWKGD